MLIQTTPEVTMVIEISFAGNAVFCEIEAATEEIAYQTAIDEIGHDYAGHRETYRLTPADTWMVVFDRH